MIVPKLYNSSGQKLRYLYYLFAAYPHPFPPPMLVLCQGSNDLMVKGCYSNRHQNILIWREFRWVWGMRAQHHTSSPGMNKSLRIYYQRFFWFRKNGGFWSKFPGRSWQPNNARIEFRFRDVQIVFIFEPGQNTLSTSLLRKGWNAFHGEQRTAKNGWVPSPKLRKLLNNFIPGQAVVIHFMTELAIIRSSRKLPSWPSK